MGLVAKKYGRLLSIVGLNGALLISGQAANPSPRRLGQSFVLQSSQLYQLFLEGNPVAT